MGKEQLDKKKIDKGGMLISRRNMPGNPNTFHRWDNVNRNMQCSIIDHVLIRKKNAGI